MITVEHWRRILDGELYAASSRIAWAVLLRDPTGQESFDFDAA
mgnify:CR=1 FL=1